MPGLKRSIDPQEKLLHHHYDMMISHGPKVVTKLAASIAEEKTSRMASAKVAAQGGQWRK
jgi:hypothetical protein